MTYVELMKSLDKLEVFMLTPVLFAFGILLVLGSLGCIIVILCNMIRDKKTSGKVKDMYTSVFALILLSILAVCSTQLLDTKYLHFKLNLAEKQSEENANDSKILAWEKEYIPKYTANLPIEKVPIVKYSDTKEEDGDDTKTKVLIVNPQTNKKEEVTIENKDIHEVTKASLDEDEPKQTYVQYAVLPKTITYKYPKNKKVDKKLIYVKQ